MAPITTSVVPLMALLLGPTSAFVTPGGGASSWSLASPQHAVRSSTSAVTTRHNARRPSSARPTSSLRMVSEVAEQKAAKLRETAAAFRAQAAELEARQEQERRDNAKRSFNTFDSNKDGSVDIAELKAGLEGPLRRSFTKTLQARMGRKPSKEEVSRGSRPESGSGGVGAYSSVVDERFCCLLAGIGMVACLCCCCPRVSRVWLHNRWDILDCFSMLALVRMIV